ncbi:hypothetical protein [Nocardia sp. XZ_19_231]|uniref:hypothetical protein n=1 Tax=Nocardia sp. XZ_19_231 TaxID=2769252 RepID=UPI001890087D|nr:hypothetical protein [Nocardia sp. XZ_19_231]
MKRVLVGAGIFTAIMAAATGMSAADAGPAPQTYAQQANVGLIEEPASGSSAIIDGILLDIVEIASGSSAKCPGPLAVCTPY